MPKFRSKPKTITAEQFRVDHKPWPINVREELDPEGDGIYLVWNELHGTAIRLRDGDYIRIDNLYDTYPIDAEYMAANYDQIADSFRCPNCGGTQEDELDKCPNCRLRYCKQCIGKPCRKDHHNTNEGAILDAKEND